MVNTREILSHRLCLVYDLKGNFDDDVDDKILSTSQDYDSILQFYLHDAVYLYVIHLYDAVYLYVRALNQTIADGYEGKAFSNGHLIYNRTIGQRFVGTTSNKGLLVCSLKLY